MLYAVPRAYATFIRACAKCCSSAPVSVKGVNISYTINDFMAIPQYMYMSLHILQLNRTCRPISPVCAEMVTATPSPSNRLSLSASVPFRCKSVRHLEFSKFDIFDVWRSTQRLSVSLWSDFAYSYKIFHKSDKPYFFQYDVHPQAVSVHGSCPLN